ncbi:MAG: autotransporter assembly complex family protein [Pseudomonadota bacterium]
MLRRGWLRWLALLLAIAALPARADIKVTIEGVDGDERLNMLTRLSVERYRERAGVDEDTMRRLANRIDEEVKDALRPFGYYEPTVAYDYRATGKDWQVAIAVKLGEPVRIRELKIAVEGPGADDSAFDVVKKQDQLRVGSRLNHGSYEDVKGAMTRIAASNGYLAAQLLRTNMVVDVAAHSASIDLAIDTGPRYHFGKVDIEQSVIRPGLMQRFLRFREGDPYSAEQVLRTQFALDDSLYFADVLVDAGEPDAQALTVPIHITANRNHPTFSIGGGYGTDTQIRGTLSWTDSLVNDRGHRFRAAITASAITREIDLRYDVPIGDPALERMSMEFINGYQEPGGLETTTTILRPSVTQMYGHWQTVTSVSATRTTTRGGTDPSFTSNLLVPGIAFASVPKNFLGEELFSRTFYAELIGSHSALGSDSNFIQLHLQSDRSFDLNYQWHLLLRGEVGVSLVDHFSELPGIYRFFAGGDRSVRGFGYDDLSPKDANGDPIGGRNLLVGSVEIVRDIPWNLALATFYDVGNAFDNFRHPLLESAVGVGVRYRLPGVALGIDVAKPVSEPNSKLRLHLNISPKL